MTQLSRAQITRKPATRSTGGIVASQHQTASEIGAEVLRAGGTAIDAAVAVSFAIGVVEPWMSGPAGGGAMMIWDAAASRAQALSYGMRAPAGLDPADFPLSGDEVASDLFPWKAVVGDRNVMGATSVAVPGTVDGIAKAHERYGRMPWAELIAPAVKLAKRGIELDWYTALWIASAARELAQDPDAAARFLIDGTWPNISGWTAVATKYIDVSSSAATLQAIADEGARVFYDGEIGAALARDVEAKGGSLRRSDLEAYQAVWQDALTVPYRDARIHMTPHLTAGPTLADTLARMQAGFAPAGAPDAGSYVATAEALNAAYATRLAEDGDHDDPRNPACTTHFSIVDAEGNMVAMTQTLLSAFGSRVVSPSTGLLLNNGVMWFDPEPGRPNSLAGGKRCLMNVCPILGETGTGATFAVGASGGRKILPAVTQLASFLTDFGMDLDGAFHQQRIDASSSGAVVADRTLSAEIREALAGRFPMVEAPRAPFPYAFACPAGVMRSGGENFGATEIMSPWGEAVAG